MATLHPTVKKILESIVTDESGPRLPEGGLEKWMKNIAAITDRKTVGEQLVFAGLDLAGKDSRGMAFIQLMLLAMFALGKTGVAASMMRHGLPKAQVDDFINQLGAMAGD